MAKKPKSSKDTERKAQRSGMVRYITFPAALDDAILREAKLHNADLGQTIRLMCADWLQGRGSNRPIDASIPLENLVEVKMGRPERKPKTPAPATPPVAPTAKESAPTHPDPKPAGAKPKASRQHA